MQRLSNKHILLGISGGIAAYKSAELTRLLVKAGAQVRVVMTKAATEFITPLTMQALSGNRIHLDLLDSESEAAMGHIELARWADLVLIAPASADIMARLGKGQANDILTTLVLATSAPVAIAPAMNQAMWRNQATQNNLQLLESRGVRIFGPADGEQACGDIGPGRMLAAEELALLSAEVFQHEDLSGINITLTAGPTREALDPVRYISNHSSGKMGYALAQACVEAGANVTLISGPVNLLAPDRVKRVDVVSAEDMLLASIKHSENCDIFIAVAAVANYRPNNVVKDKIKKSTDTLQIDCVQNPDIVATIARQKNRPFTVGFAAETRQIKEYGRDKLKRKNLDLLFANHATDTFNNDEGAATAIWQDGEQELKLCIKSLLAKQMLQLIKQHFDMYKSIN